MTLVPLCPSCSTLAKPHPAQSTSPDFARRSVAEVEDQDEQPTLGISRTSNLRRWAGSSDSLSHMDGMGLVQDQGHDQALQDFLRRAVASSSSSSTSVPVSGPFRYHDQGLDQNRVGGPLTFGLEPDYGYGAATTGGGGHNGMRLGSRNGQQTMDGDGMSSSTSKIRSNGGRNFSGMSASTAASASGSGSAHKRKRRRADEAHLIQGRSADHHHHRQYHQPNSALDPDLNSNMNMERGSETGETPRSRYSDDDEDEDSLEDQGTYEPTAPTPLPLSLPEPSDQGYRRYSRPTHSLPHHLDVDPQDNSNSHPHLKSATTSSNPNGTITTTAKRRGRPALPPQERDERRRERARQSAAETRRKKRDVEGEREWWKEVEIEKAVLEEKYRTLVRE